MIITLGIGTIIILVSPKFQGQRWRIFRVYTVVGIGLLALAPIIHGIKLFGFSQMDKQSGLAYYLLEGCLLALGASFYTLRIPEAYEPEKFDIFGCSHQIFYVPVVFATAVHLIGLLLAFDYNYQHRACGGGFIALELVD
ncbi:hypothetical protein EG329_001698 [Mollisiaceae sp. DMI_Dod_QoI]|nr:hypothetical protein EG329_001698 [Helotiales sp. DMI_Dod_QoI]